MRTAVLALGLVLVVSWLFGPSGEESTPTAQPAPGQTSAPPLLPPPTEAPPSTPPTPSPTPSPKVEVPEAGSGQNRVARFTRPAPQGQRGRLVRTRVVVENEVGLDVEEVARTAAEVLQDGRSWNSRGEGRFEFVGDAPADLEIRVLTPKTTDRNCLPLDTGGEVSCRQGGGVNLNARRWVEAVPDYANDVPAYRHYLVNHEVGHFLGHNHVQCPGQGAPAPVMMQQTKGLDGCARNVWPLPGRAP